MDKFAYTLSPGNIKPFLEKIQTAGVPPKLSLTLLKSLGFKSSNNRTLIAVMKALGFISSKGVPTEKWTLFRDRTTAKRVLADAIREHYDELFKLYPDAHRKDNEALTNFFTSQTKLGERAVGAMVQTFKALVENADFESPDFITPPLPVTVSDQVPDSRPVRTHVSNQGTVININIQLTLPDTTNVDTYEAIFKALKKHILSQE